METVALYDYEKQDDDELSLKVGDVITVTDVEQVCAVCAVSELCLKTIIYGAHAECSQVKENMQLVYLPVLSIDQCLQHILSTTMKISGSCILASCNGNWKMETTINTHWSVTKWLNILLQTESRMKPMYVSPPDLSYFNSIYIDISTTRLMEVVGVKEWAEENKDCFQTTTFDI